MGVGLVLLDLDGTLLTSEKRISPATYAALERAAKMGVHIVPCTGRPLSGMPAVVRELPFVRYAVTVNGGSVCDTVQDAVLFRAELPLARAQDLFDYMDGLPVIYDCFVDGAAYMAREFYGRIDEFISAPQTNLMVRQVRRPVDDFRGFIARTGKSVQKVQMFFADMVRREEELDRLPGLFPDLTVTTSIVNNIEFTHPAASKGAALRFLAGHLGVAVEDTMAFGDMSNDLSMVEAAGIGVAMGNADQCLKDAADHITDTNDADGVAKAFETFLFT